ncbi:FecR family protein [Pedobacter caeni]|uniref:FecR family protein n=1 Tax=Pedobacter caeni TaxID=288992 RepID=A0A1M4V6N3_9SPHI|nr:FecR family protein [Pedobacter caeni]SHE64624.1 FecR family protein [Pedobacter caeni]
MGSNKAQELIQKYLNNSAGLKEQETVESWYIDYARRRKDQLPEPDYAAVETEIWAAVRPNQKHNRGWQVFTIAASLFIGLGVGIYFYLNPDPVLPTPSLVNDIAPGKNSAVLTLGNGKTIPLNGAKSGIVIKPSTLAYNDGTTVTAAETKGFAYSTISTPLGGQYQVELPDGTVVALNAGSTLKFPVTFSGSANRTVELSGEAYFKVAKDAEHPFIVKTASQLVEVLGTHFNVNAYVDEPATVTTLEEGSVMVSAVAKGKNSGVILKPSQQSILTNADKINIKTVNVADVLGWKNGFFIFEEEELESVMRKISRWYDVEIYYQDKMPQISFLGVLSRKKNLSALLHMLEKSGDGNVHFKIQGRRILVMK